jgi:hypothetical protein
VQEAAQHAVVADAGFVDRDRQRRELLAFSQAFKFM